MPETKTIAGIWRLRFSDGTPTAVSVIVGSDGIITNASSGWTSWIGEPLDGVVEDLEKFYTDVTANRLETSDA